jgi:uncharacterized protein (DUF362 family)
MKGLLAYSAPLEGITVSSVSFVQTKRPNIKKAIEDSLNLIDYNFKENIKRVVIKPNMCYYWDYSTGQTTDPRFVGALIDLIRSRISPSVRISVVESDASAMKCKYAFKMLGYAKLAQECKIELVNLSEDKSDAIEMTAGTQSFRLEVPETIQHADLRINVPKIKYTMENIKITCALKNIFGCNPYPKKFRYHSRLEEAIVAINKVMHFDLCIVDGMIVSGIKPCRLGLVMASEDPVAFDTAAARIAGINPKTIGYLKLAEKEGLGNMNFTQRGIPLNRFEAEYPRRNIQNKLMAKAYGLIVTMGLGKRLGLV